MGTAEGSRVGASGDEAGCPLSYLQCLASLSTQSLNQFAENMSKAEALSAEIASIHRGLQNTRESSDNTISSSAESELTIENAGMTRF